MTLMKGKNKIDPPAIVQSKLFLFGNLYFQAILIRGKKNFELSCFLSRQSFDLIQRLRAGPQYQISSAIPPHKAEIFVFIKHFWVCAAMVSQFQPVHYADLCDIQQGKPLPG